ncbi:type II toxin-antitoxin system antitoxin SocA domain-containing protein [Megasphaera sp.]|uniref:type II toxin-antitoxin system antitoxin SocA domain-containing protein n=1 Tax=Megasphaera sp. TaxID=2023260 RepID=UPI0025E849F0|nr:type II toxin-antitoxin system antitoxin SocA domain-containing protein [uncultured Megasphaera sp.]
MMSEKRRIDFCTTCRKETPYTLEKQTIVKNIKDKDYTFTLTTAVCDECGSFMSPPGLIDKNVQEMDTQYRTYENIVSVHDIKRLMAIYKMGQGPLSLALGFGEVTITRYLSGQIPSKEYSDIIRNALISPRFMKKMLYENRDKITPAAYNKAIKAAEELEDLFAVSDKILGVIYCLFEQLTEITPLMLQKLLYFVQGISYANHNTPIFPEDCQAWTHGPVYPEIYTLFKQFRYNPIEDPRFVIFEGTDDKLTVQERHIVELVANTFGEYTGKPLERITHQEAPWQDARKGYGDGIPSNELISKQSIRDYYLEKEILYDFSSPEGIKKYIEEMCH